MYFCSKCFAFQKYLLHRWPTNFLMLFEGNGLTASKAQVVEVLISIVHIMGQCVHDGET